MLKSRSCSVSRKYYSAKRVPYTGIERIRAVNTAWDSTAEKPTISGHTSRNLNSKVLVSTETPNMIPPLNDVIATRKGSSEWEEGITSAKRA